MLLQHLGLAHLAPSGGVSSKSLETDAGYRARLEAWAACVRAIGLGDSWLRLPLELESDEETKKE